VIVDDCLAILTVLALIFRQRGYSVRTVSDGLAALALLHDRVPDVLLSDLNMPGMSAFELMSVVRGRFAVIFVIAMSGTDYGTAVPHFIAADGFCAKSSGSISRLFETLSGVDETG
jgi:CheY-like chemotaxis protein